MKDGEIWVVEYKRMNDKWGVMTTFSTKKLAIDSIKHHYRAISSSTKYRVVKYVRGEDRLFDPVCRKCGDPLTTYELICDDCGQEKPEPKSV